MSSFDAVEMLGFGMDDVDEKGRIEVESGRQILRVALASVTAERSARLAGGGVAAGGVVVARAAGAEAVRGRRRPRPRTLARMSRPSSVRHIASTPLTPASLAMESPTWV